MEERLRKAEEAARAAVNELWETRFEMAKDELKEEMRKYAEHCVVHSKWCGSKNTGRGFDRNISIVAAPSFAPRCTRCHELFAKVLETPSLWGHLWPDKVSEPAATRTVTSLVNP